MGRFAGGNETLRFFSASRIEGLHTFGQYYSAKLGAIFSGEYGEDRGIQFSSYADFDIRVRVRRIKEQFEENLLMLVDGDLVQLSEIRKLSVEQYLILLGRKTEQAKAPKDGR